MVREDNMSILSWFTKKKTFNAYDPHKQVIGLTSMLNFVSNERIEEVERIIGILNDIEIGKLKARSNDSVRVLKGYLAGLIFVGQLLEGHLQGKIYKDLSESEDFREIWLELTPYGDWRDLPRPPASAVKEMNSD